MKYFFTSVSKPDPPNICYHIEGFINCSYFDAAVKLSEDLKGSSDKNPIQVSVNPHKKENWADRIKELHSLIPKSKDHITSPLVYEGCNPNKYEFIGGYSDFAELVRVRHKPDLQKDSKQESGRECVGDVCKI